MYVYCTHINFHWTRYEIWEVQMLIRKNVHLAESSQYKPFSRALTQVGFRTLTQVGKPQKNFVEKSTHTTTHTVEHRLMSKPLKDTTTKFTCWTLLINLHVSILFLLLAIIFQRQKTEWETTVYSLAIVPSFPHRAPPPPLYLIRNIVLIDITLELWTCNCYCSYRVLYILPNQLKHLKVFLSESI